MSVKNVKTGVVCVETTILGLVKEAPEKCNGKEIAPAHITMFIQGFGATNFSLSERPFHEPFGVARKYTCPAERTWDMLRELDFTQLVTGNMRVSVVVNNGQVYDVRPVK